MTVDATKITLSAKELELVCNTDWILTKHIIINKVIELFGRLLQSMQEQTVAQKNSLPVEIFQKDPKISKGENYRQLPYVMLDYPRYFAKQDTLSIRTFFWWGNFFSINMQLSGDVKNNLAPNLIDNFLHLQNNDYWICVNNNPWQHYFEDDNYLPFQKITIEQFSVMLNRESFVKIGKKISVGQWEAVTPFLERSFQEMIWLLKS
jgi:hypothetical protein